MKSMCGCRGMCANPRVGMFILRLVVGAIFIYHGWTKFQNLEGTRMFFASIHLYPWLATLVAAVELVGGIALVLGLWTCTFAALLAIDMAVALVWTKFGNWQWGRVELEVLLLASTLAVKHCGAGGWKMGKSCGCMMCSGGSTGPNVCNSCNHEGGKGGDCGCDCHKN